MQGFVSFMLFFVGIAIILVILSSDFSFNESKMIALSRIDSLDLDIKNSMLDLSLDGGYKGAKDYLDAIRPEVEIREIPLLAPEEIENLKKYAREQAIIEINIKIEKLIRELKNDGFEVVIWCGTASESNLKKTLDLMIRGQQALTPQCVDCHMLSNPVCADFIHIKPTVLPEAVLSSLEIRFEKELDIDSIPQVGEGVIGVSIYYKKFSMGSISYIPINEVRTRYAI